MLTTVEFDHKLAVMAGKVRKIRSDGRLSTEMRAADRQLTQMPPELPLGIGHRAAQASRARHARVRRLRSPPVARHTPHP
jgi:hypothetical protein